MTPSDGSIKTDKMSLAVVLNIYGYAPVMERAGNAVVWVLRAEEVDDHAFELVEEYLSGACRVEPKRFAVEQKRVREEMYRFLGASQQPRGTRISMDPSGA